MLALETTKINFIWYYYYYFCVILSLNIHFYGNTAADLSL